MARKEARLRSSIWDDADFLALTLAEQYVYLYLISQPDVAYTGVVPIRVRRWARKLPLSVDELLTALKGLEAARFVVLDEDTEELLIRSFIRSDELYKQPNLLKSALSDLGSVESTTIKATLYGELVRVKALPMPQGSREPLGGMLAALKPFAEASGSSAAVAEEPTPEPETDTAPEPQAKPFEEPQPEPFEEPQARPSPDGSGDRSRSTEVGGSLTVRTTKAPSSRKPRDEEAENSPEFIAFWEAWPRKVDKVDAAKAWSKALSKTKPGTKEPKITAAELIDAAKVFAAACARNNTEQKFIPYPTTWLNKERWRDAAAIATDLPKVPVTHVSSEDQLSKWV